MSSLSPPGAFPRLETLVGHARELPPSGRLLPQLQQLFRDPTAGTHQLTQLMRMDSNLTTRILRLANSAIYAGAEPCESIDAATQRVGLEAIEGIIGVLVAKDLHDQDLEIYRTTSAAILYQSLAAALAASAFNQKAHFGAGGDRIFTVGILHCVGMVALNNFVLVERPEQVSELRRLRLDAAREREFFGVDHAQLGAAILASWNFSPAMVGLLAELFTELEKATRPEEVAVLQLGLEAVPSIDRWASPEILADSPAAIRLGLTKGKIGEALLYAEEMFEFFAENL
ncbi:MAG: HDOD domain-containing protein [Opitutales bacterium]